ncbi:MAG: 4Fe-4S dicluster domain-containing protein [Methanothrix sp.]|nr:4Fe-4S dicluster domain-containing protein [Methanothrix sp.]MDD4448243.1 4Fe-4S dicluster domain-containing protein [Methanothrix sp.]
MIKVDASLCLGCRSCSNVCPSQNIVRTETQETRSIHWKRCKEECDLCVEFCPAKALTLVAFDETTPEPDVSFDLIACKICKSRYATEPMLRRIESVIPVNLQKDSEGLDWIRVCPVCRRNIEADRATKQMVLGRSRKTP